MAEHPLIFSAPMIRAILEGRKSVTRRMSKNPDYYTGWKKGDRVWVRETWGIGCRPDPHTGDRDGIEYRADLEGLGENDDLPLYEVITPEHICLGDYASGWKPSIHMPRWASRITLELTADVRQEPLHTMTEPEAKREGVEGGSQDEDGNSLWFRLGFAELWDSMHPDHPWISNPTVSVIEFSRI